MFILHIEHPVPDVTLGKELFDDNHVSRGSSGLLGYKILQPVDGASFVIVDLEFDTSHQAQSFLSTLRTQWQSSEGRVMKDPVGRIFEVVEISGAAEE